MQWYFRPDRPISGSLRIKVWGFVLQLLLGAFRVFLKMWIKLPGFQLRSLWLFILLLLSLYLFIWNFRAFRWRKCSSKCKAYKISWWETMSWFFSPIVHGSSREEELLMGLPSTEALPLSAVWVGSSWILPPLQGGVGPPEKALGEHPCHRD